nr:CIH_HP1_G0052140.mRNA.1.CDS.1 [Saccharomyces cerevisiae]
MSSTPQGTSPSSGETCYSFCLRLMVLLFWYLLIHRKERSLTDGGDHTPLAPISWIAILQILAWDTNRAPCPADSQNIL